MQQIEQWHWISGFSLLAYSLLLNFMLMPCLCHLSSKVPLPEQVEKEIQPTQLHLEDGN